MDAKWLGSNCSSHKGLILHSSWIRTLLFRMASKLGGGSWGYDGSADVSQMLSDQQRSGKKAALMLYSNKCSFRGCWDFFFSRSKHQRSYLLARSFGFFYFSLFFYSHGTLYVTLVRQAELLCLSHLMDDGVLNFVIARRINQTENYCSKSAEAVPHTVVFMRRRPAVVSSPKQFLFILCEESICI